MAHDNAKDRENDEDYFEVPEDEVPAAVVAPADGAQDDNDEADAP